MFSNSDPSSDGLGEEESPPVLLKGTVQQKEIYQVGLPFMGPEPGMVMGNRCLSKDCKGRHCWHRNATQLFFNDKPVGFEGEFYFVKHVFVVNLFGVYSSNCMKCPQQLHL